MKNIRSTLLGIGTILGAVAMALVAMFDGDPTTVVNIEATIAAISAGIGLMLMREEAQHVEDKKDGTT